ncbi:GntR family transcriptional regulator [Saccharopolyspora taberi]|uniref:HTH gntR-type domain-containing protein n=1 Tax=Saccharopolyspora taberi TaxID=60895 RepID=A0ABN3VET4_9PSEU
MPPKTSDAARSTRAYVVELLRDAIIEGRLAPGSRLGQDQLRAEFSASAAPVREALRELESEGLVTHYPNRGSFVAEIDPDEFREVLLPIRLHLERHAAHKVLADPPAGLWDDLDEIVTGMRGAADRGDLRAITEADVRFHRTLVEAAHSAHTARIWAGIESRVRMQFNRLGRPERRLSAIADEHRSLLDQLRGGDRESIDAELEAHIVTAAERLLSDAETS